MMYSEPTKIPEPPSSGQISDDKFSDILQRLDESHITVDISADGRSFLYHEGTSVDELTAEQTRQLSERITELAIKNARDHSLLHQGDGVFSLRPNTPAWTEAVNQMIAYDEQQRQHLHETLTPSSSTGPMADFSNVRFFALGSAQAYAERTIAALQASDPEATENGQIKLSDWNRAAYPDGPTNYRLPNVRGKSIVVFMDPSRDPDRTLAQLQGFLGSAISNQCNPNNITVISPYFPMRSDRPTRGQREDTMYRNYMERVRNAGAHRILIYEPHFNQFGLISASNFRVEATFPTAALLPYMEKKLVLQEKVPGLRWKNGVSLFQQPSIGLIGPDGSSLARNEKFAVLANLNHAQVAIVKKRREQKIDSTLLTDQQSKLPEIAISVDDIGSSLKTVVLAAALAKYGSISDAERKQLESDPITPLKGRKVVGPKIFISVLTHFQAVSRYAEKALASPLVDAWVVSDTCTKLDMPLGKFGPKGPFGNRVHVVSTAQITADALTTLFAKPSASSDPEPSMSQLANSLIPPDRVLSLFGSDEKNIW